MKPVKGEGPEGQSGTVASQCSDMMTPQIGGSEQSRRMNRRDARERARRCGRRIPTSRLHSASDRIRQTSPSLSSTFGRHRWSQSLAQHRCMNHQTLPAIHRDTGIHPSRHLRMTLSRPRMSNGAPAQTTFPFPAGGKPNLHGRVAIWPAKGD